MLRETSHEQFKARPVPATSKTKAKRDNPITSEFDDPLRRVEELGPKEIRGLGKNPHFMQALKELGMSVDDVVPLSMQDWQRHSAATMHRRPATPSALKLHYRHDAGAGCVACPCPCLPVCLAGPPLTHVVG